MGDAKPNCISRVGVVGDAKTYLISRVERVLGDATIHFISRVGWGAWGCYTPFYSECGGGVLGEKVISRGDPLIWAHSYEQRK